MKNEPKLIVLKCFLWKKRQYYLSSYRVNYEDKKFAITHIFQRTPGLSQTTALNNTIMIVKTEYVVLPESSVYSTERKHDKIGVSSRGTKLPTQNAYSTSVSLPLFLRHLKDVIPHSTIRTRSVH
jgi:hypothetical protein